LAVLSLAYYRFLVLFFACLLTFGSYFCFDMPSVLQDQFQGVSNITCYNGTFTNHSRDCIEGLGMSPQEFNFLYAIYAWTNAVVVIVAGFLIDKLGNRFGLFLFSLLTVLGSSIFALGSHFKGTSYMLPIMLIGRLLFGAGNGSLTIVQARVAAFWFKGKELALALCLTRSFSRLGSVLNFFITEEFECQYGIQWTLWGGTILCILGFLSAVIVSELDIAGVKQLGLDGAIKEESKKVRAQDIQHLPLRYWLLALTIMFFYTGIHPFVADASKFIQDKYDGYDRRTAGYIAGAVYDSPLFLSAAIGILIDYIGMRGVMVFLCSVLTPPVFALLAFTYVPPLVATLWLGVMYCLAAASMWPSIPLLVRQATLGMAMGIATSMQMIGIGLSNLIVGAILGSKSSEAKIPLWRWQEMMIYMLVNTIACIATSVALNVVDRKKVRTNKVRRNTKPNTQVESRSGALPDTENE
uniref:Lysosomal dipeptide transporter MFSD1 n=1 Tax=Leptobrachium leishanense TaxID=445787 RepID=A0A8C5R2F7_9ANUR